MALAPAGLPRREFIRSNPSLLHAKLCSLCLYCRNVQSPQGTFVAANDQSIGGLLLKLLEAARKEVAPYITFLPDWMEPYAVHVVAGVILLGVVVAAFKKYVIGPWPVVIWAPRSLWRWAIGYQPPKSDAAVARETAQRMEVTLEEVRALLAAQADKAEAGGTQIPEDAVERAVAAVREVRVSNDPSKAEAQDALRKGDLQGAERALEAAFDRESAAAARLSDEAQQLATKAARTAREKAALAATRSVAEALRWYEKAAALEPEDFWTQVEMARLNQASGNIGVALTAAQAALQVAKVERNRSVALDEIGDVLRSQGDLGKALESYQASMVIRKRLAQADASNAGLQRDLSVSHNKIGDLWEARGEISLAIEAYDKSLVIAQSLADRFPDHRQFQSDVAISKRRLAELRAKLS
ncbi:MAG: hypothetical protein ACFCUQ_07770 [Kiloniellales bacterium]